ncbi:MAG: hypothetical protein COC04_03515 [Gammaproteobacteria bacterium]|nr:MAG: hypothetical protein COC04_03515 [Gammaproteobacteria bacterium]
MNVSDITEFAQARHVARMAREQVMDYLDISKRTFKHYEPQGTAPKAIIECLRMMGGQLPSFNRRNDFTDRSFCVGFFVHQKVTNSQVVIFELESWH